MRVRAALGLAMALVAGAALAAGASQEIRVVRVDGSINPSSVDFMIQAIEEAERDAAAAILIELDTPGGLVSSTKDVVGVILNADVPVIVYVTPRGAMASSAGTFITMSAHVAAMSPSTTIGAAHPVSPMGANPKPPPGAVPGADPETDGRAGDPKGILPGGGSAPATPASPANDYSLEKMENVLAKYSETIAKERGRNAAWAEQAVRNSVVIDAEEAVELNVVDLIAESRSDLVAAIEGRVIKLKDREHTLELAGATFVDVEMTLGQRVFHFLADPTVAMMLLVLGGLGLYIEFQSPGMIVPGAVGAACLLLTAFAFQILPFSWLGLTIFVVGFGLIAAEAFVSAFGALFAAGLACLLVGGSMLFDQPAVSDLNISFWSVLVPIVGAFAVFGGLVVFAVGRVQWTAQTAGVDELIGLVGRSSTALAPQGKIFVRGEYWNATADGDIAEGEAVQVTAVEGMVLRVRRADPA